MDGVEIIDMWDWMDFARTNYFIFATTMYESVLASLDFVHPSICQKWYHTTTVQSTYRCTGTPSTVGTYIHSEYRRHHHGYNYHHV